MTEQDRFTVSDERPSYYSQLPHSLLNGKISHSAYVVYGALDSFRNRKTGQLNPGKEKLAKRAGVSRGRLTKYLKELVKVGAIEIRRPQHVGVNHYVLRAMDHSTIRCSATASVGALPTASPGATNHMNLNQKKEPGNRSSLTRTPKKNGPVPTWARDFTKGGGTISRGDE